MKEHFIIRRLNTLSRRGNPTKKHTIEFKTNQPPESTKKLLYHVLTAAVTLNACKIENKNVFLNPLNSKISETT